MNTLAKKLEKISDNSVTENEEIVQEAKLLLASNVAEERRTLAAIGLDNDIRMVDSKNEEIIIRKTNGERLGKKILNYKDIKKFCLDYRLYMRKANQYIGTIPPELGSELTRFCKEKNIPLTHADHSNFYIIAPPKMFHGYQTPIEVLADSLKITLEEAEERRERERLRRLDPILVYKLDSDHYALIKSWGNDFSWLRRAYGFFTKKRTAKVLQYLSVFLVPLLFYKIAAFGYSYFRHLAHIAPQQSGTEILSVVACIVIIGAAIILSAIWIFNEDYQKFRKKVVEKITYNEEKMKKRSEYIYQ